MTAPRSAVRGRRVSSCFLRSKAPGHPRPQFRAASAVGGSPISRAAGPLGSGFVSCVELEMHEAKPDPTDPADRSTWSPTARDDQQHQRPPALMASGISDVGGRLIIPAGAGAPFLVRIETELSIFAAHFPKTGNGSLKVGTSSCHTRSAGEAFPPP